MKTKDRFVSLYGIVFLLAPSSVFAGQIVSSDSNGNALSGWSSKPSISADGRFVVFENVLKIGEDRFAGQQIFKKDLVTGTLTLISATREGIAGDRKSYSPRLSKDGRFVAFESIATNLIARSTSQQIYLKDTLTGEIRLVSSNVDGFAGNFYSNLPVASLDGESVFFQSNSSNLISHGDRVYRLYSKNIRSGEVSSVGTNSRGEASNAPTLHVELDSTNSLILFESAATNLVSGTKGSQVYCKKLENGKTMLVSSTSSGQAANANAGQASVARQCQFVAFSSSATNLVAGAKGQQVYMKDMRSGTVRLVSSDGSGQIGNGFSGFTQISEDGKNITFISTSSNWIKFPNPLSRYRVYRKNMDTGELIAVGKPGTYLGTISATADGTHAAFGVVNANGSTVELE